MMSPTGQDPLVYAFDIPAEQSWSRVLKRGQTLRIIDSEGEQAVDALIYALDDTAERYSAQDTLRVQGSAYLQLGTKLISNRRENFILELSRHGLTKRDIVSNLNFFMNVPIEPTGNFTVLEGPSSPGNYVDVTAEIGVLFVISNCPQVNNPCNGFDPTPIRVEIRDPAEA
jgi:uncharacterized protein